MADTLAGAGKSLTFELAPLLSSVYLARIGMPSCWCFKSERETGALASSRKFPKPSCVVTSLHNSGVIELSVEGRTSRAANRALLLLSFFCSLVSRSEARA